MIYCNAICYGMIFKSRANSISSQVKAKHFCTTDNGITTRNHGTCLESTNHSIQNIYIYIYVEKITSTENGFILSCC